MALIECVPNISEGVRTEVVAGIVEALRAIEGLHVLDVQSDATHNRSVLTLAGEPAVLRVALPRLCELTIAEVDLRTHRGEHPRLGAVDVMPFIPLEGATMAECVALAREVGADIGGRLRVPEGGETVGLAGFVLLFAALSLSRFKLPHYIFAAYPFAALLCAYTLNRLLDDTLLGIRHVLQAQWGLYVLGLVLISLLGFWVFADSPLVLNLAVVGGGVLVVVLA